MDAGGPILFYDGVCGLCDRLVQFVLRRDRRQLFRFAALQSDVATQALGHFGKDPEDLDTMYVLDRRRAPVAEVARHLLRAARARAAVVDPGARSACCRPSMTDWFYDRVAHNRYRIWGKRESCRLPSATSARDFWGDYEAEGAVVLSADCVSTTMRSLPSTSQ